MPMPYYLYAYGEVNSVTTDINYVFAFELRYYCF